MEKKIYSCSKLFFILSFIYYLFIFILLFLFIVPPSPPQNVIAEIENNSAKRKRRSTSENAAADIISDQYTLKIRWTPGDDGNSDVLHYVVNHAVKDRDSNWVVTKLPSDQHWFMVHNITQLTVYFKVAAQNEVGVGGFTPAYQFDIVPATIYTPGFHFFYSVFFLVFSIFFYLPLERLSF